MPAVSHPAAIQLLKYPTALSVFKAARTCSVSCWCASSLASATTAASVGLGPSFSPAAVAGGLSGVSASRCACSSSHCAFSYRDRKTNRG